MPDLSNAFAQWLLRHLDNLPENILRDGAELLTADRLLAHIFEERESAHLRALLRSPRQEQRDRVATVLLPGVLGSLLASIRGISALLWFNPMILMDGHLNLLDLAPDGRSDRSPDVEIVPIGIEKLTYLNLIRTLAAHSRLYQFPYDWRRHIEWNADQLLASLQRWNLATPNRRYVLIGHSMGGLVARTFLARHPKEAERLVERVIMIGSPVYGALGPALSFSQELHPGRIVARLNEQNDMVGFTSNLPSTYQLLPPPPDLFRPSRPYPFDWDIYDARAWPVPHVRQDYLDDAQKLHRLLLEGPCPDIEVINIAGCHCQTIVAIHRNGESGPMEPIYQETGPESGDGQVPLWSAQGEGIQVYYIQEIHNRLVSNDSVLEAIIQILRGEKASLPTEVPAPRQPLQALRAIPILQQVAELREHIEQGRLSRRDIEKFFFH